MSCLIAVSAKLHVADRLKTSLNLAQKTCPKSLFRTFCMAEPTRLFHRYNKLVLLSASSALARDPADLAPQGCQAWDRDLRSD